MSKCEDGLDMTVYTVYAPKEIQMRVGLSVSPSLTDIECAMHLPKGAVLCSSSIPPAKVEKQTVTWMNPSVSLWDVTVAPSSEHIIFTASGKDGNEKISVERVVQGGENFISAKLSVRNHSGNTSGYRPDDVLEIEIRLYNHGEMDAVQLLVNHMLRDYLSYIPDTLQASAGDAALVFRLVRWRIPLLRPKEEAVLTFQARAEKGNPRTHISLGGTYTFQAGGMMYGPYEANGILLPKQ